MSKRAHGPVELRVRHALVQGEAPDAAKHRKRDEPEVIDGMEIAGSRPAQADDRHDLHRRG